MVRKIVCLCKKFGLEGFKVDFSFFKAVFVGGITSSVCSVVPGVGNAQAATIVSVFFRKMSAELFIVMLSVINTINFALSIVTFYLISRARNGSILVVSQIWVRLILVCCGFI